MARTKISHPNVRARETAGLEARDYEAFIGGHPFGTAGSHRRRMTIDTQRITEDACDPLDPFLSDGERVGHVS